LRPPAESLLTDQFTDLTNTQGNTTQAVRVQQTLLKTMTKRKVIEPVLTDIKVRIQTYSKKDKKATS
jgi:hypothetical protein